MNNINVKENIKVKIVSLKNSDRRDNFIDLPISYSFFDAVENNHLDTFNVKKSEEKYQREIRNGEVGCSLSHYQLYKDLSKSCAEYYLILEDDAVLLDSGKLLDLYYELLNKKFSKPTILILGHSKVAVEDFKWQKLKQPLFDKFNLAGSKFGYKNVNTCGTVSYFINKKAAEKIVRNEMVYWLADDWNELSSFGIDVFHIENPIIKEDLQFSSSTGNDVFSYHSFIKHPIKSIFQIFYYRILYILGIRKWL